MEGHRYIFSVRRWQAQKQHTTNASEEIQQKEIFDTLEALLECGADVNAHKLSTTTTTMQQPKYMKFHHQYLLQ